MARNTDLKCYYGDTFTRTGTVYDANNNPIDLTGKEVDMYIKFNKEDLDEDAVLKISGVINPDQETHIGEVAFTENPIEIQRGPYYWVAKYHDDGSSYTETVGDGTIVIL